MITCTVAVLFASTTPYTTAYVSPLNDHAPTAQGLYRNAGSLTELGRTTYFLGVVVLTCEAKKSDDIRIRQHALVW